jgi:C1A family cysteine protease
MYFASQAVGGYTGQGDTGTCSHDVANALAQVGYCPESAYPYVDDSSKIDPGAMLEQLKRLAYDQRFQSTARVDSDTMSVAQCDSAVASALNAGYLLPFAIDVDSAFENLLPGQIWPGPRGQILGGHCTTIVGRGPANKLCRYTSSTEIVLKILNSWGPSFCDAGYYLMSLQALASRYDIYCASKTPAYSGTV